MSVVQRKLSKSFKAFFDSEKSSGILLIICTVVSLVLANSILGANYLSIWQMYIGGLSIEHWVNDALMAIFFLLIGLELKREIYNGELSDFKNALLPIFAALGGIVFPALIHCFSTLVEAMQFHCKNLLCFLFLIQKETIKQISFAFDS